MTQQSGNENVPLLKTSCGCIALWSVMAGGGEEIVELTDTSSFDGDQLKRDID